MHRGKIRKLVADKGFGFIACEQRHCQGQGEDLFFHVSAVRDAKFESLAEGQPVQFETETGGDWTRASLVRPV